jgi:hypothetical protein
MIFRLAQAAAPTERALRYPIEQVLFFGQPAGAS